MNEQRNMEQFYDVVIVGGGPAGLTAALYLARACYRVLVIEKDTFGGQITITSEVVNYPGVARCGGKELTETMRRQAESFGAEFLLAEVTELSLKKDVKTVKTPRGDYFCFGVLIAVGAHPRMIGFPGEKEFRGRGVAYCATCDGEFFTGKEIFVVGGGFAAAEESVFLTKYAKHVTILIREEDFTCAEAVAKPAREHPNITVLTDTEVVELKGDHMLQSIRYKNNKTGEETVFAPENDTFGVFVFAGYEPATELVKGIVELDSHGYISVDENQKTNLDGVYGAGDVCVKNLRQVVTAVGDGATAATELERYAKMMQEKTDIHPKKPKGKSLEEAQTQKEEKKVLPDENGRPEDSLFSPEIHSQLSVLFSKMEQMLILQLYTDDRPISEELVQYMEALANQTDKLMVTRPGVEGEYLPMVQVLKSDGTETGLAFHGVPGGHEFTSFILGLYNASGPGQPLEGDLREKIMAIDHPVRMQILVSLSCTMCPDLVVAAQRIAALNPQVTAEVYDINHFPDLKERYEVMSVPCLVINEEQVLFGKKSLPELLDILF